MNVSSLHSQTPRRKWLRRLGWALFIYAVIGFLILPPIIRAVAVRQLSKELGRDVSIEKVRLNPFALSATVRGLLIKDKDGQPFISWDEVYVNFQLSSFFGKAWVFSEISTTQPFVRAQMNKDYSLNFSDLIAKAKQASATAPPPSPAKPLAVRVDLLQIKGASASLTDLTPRSPFARTLGPLDVTLLNFRTDPDNKNPYAFAGTTDAGEKFAWSGYFSLDPVRSEGKLSLRNITLNKYSPLYEDLVRFLIRDGTVDLGATYRFEISATNCVASVTNASFALHSFKLAEPRSEENMIELPDFAVDGVSVDVTTRHAEVESISGTGGRFFVRRDTNAVINVIEISKPGEAAANAPGGVLLLLQSVTNAVAMLFNDTNKWTGFIREVNIHDDTLIVEDLVNSRATRIQLDQISVTAKNISNSLGSNLTSSVSFRWNTNGTVKVDTEATLKPLSADVHLALDNLELRPLDPYLESKLDVFILKSKLGLAGKGQLRTAEGSLPEIKFFGDVWLNDFLTVDGVLAEDLLRWKSVRVSGIEANLNPMEVAIKEIAVNDAFAKVVVETNRTINLMAALRMVDTNALPPVAAKPAASKRGKKSPVVAQENSASATNATAGELLPKISIASVVISNAELRLTDRSLSRPVNIAVQQLGGTISGLSSDDLQHAVVDLHAKVDNAGPVSITGTINPLGKNLATDLKIVVSNVDLTPTSPYSGKFAGYGIAKGKLGVQLEYKISGRKLSAKNVITLDQFTFGEKVNSPDATKLPVKLGVAVLKDRNGKIELDVPVEGSLDDPEFHFGKVITRAIWNVITKVLTSPFSVLGSVFGGGGEELNFQEFTPGRAVLLASEKVKLDSLAKGLHERPALQLEIEGSINPDADRAGLRRMKLEKQIRTKKWMSLRTSERSAITPEQVTLSPEEGATWLKTLYNAALEKGEIALTPVATNSAALDAGLSTIVATEPMKGAGALLSVPKAKSKNSPAAIADAPPATNEVKLRRANDANEMAAALMAAIPVSEGDFKELAAERAKVVREYILQTGQAEAERIFLTESQPSGVKTQGSRAYLELK